MVNCQLWCVMLLAGLTTTVQRGGPEATIAVLQCLDKQLAPGTVLGMHLCTYSSLICSCTRILLIREEQYGDASPTAAPPLDHQGSPTAGSPYGTAAAAAGSSSPYAAADADPQRAELFRGARKGVGSDGKPAARSAAEIRAAYGRPA